MITLGIIISKIGIYFKSIKLLILGVAQKIPYLIAISFVYINIYIKNLKLVMIVFLIQIVFLH